MVVSNAVTHVPDDDSISDSAVDKTCVRDAVGLFVVGHIRVRATATIVSDRAVPGKGNIATARRIEVRVYFYLIPRLSGAASLDRKSTRLNSSHANISYA